MRTILQYLLALSMTAMVTGVSPAFAAGHAHMDTQQQTTTITKLADLKAGLRDLWLGHVFWVRSVAVATKYGDTVAAKTAEDKVVENAKAIAAAIEPFYGKAAEDKLFTLLAGHYGAVKEYMLATYGNDSAGKTVARDKLLKNADEIALFLSGANQYLPKETLTTLLYAHGGHHIAQFEALTAKDYSGEARIWDDMKGHMYVIADALAGGLAKQFPKLVE